MAEQLCPACGQAITGEGFEKEGVKYCCQPCAASSGPCQRPPGDKRRPTKLGQRFGNLRCGG